MPDSSLLDYHSVVDLLPEIQSILCKNDSKINALDFLDLLAQSTDCTRTSQSGQSSDVASPELSLPLAGTSESDRPPGSPHFR